MGQHDFAAMLYGREDTKRFDVVYEGWHAKRDFSIVCCVCRREPKPHTLRACVTVYC